MRRHPRPAHARRRRRRAPGWLLLAAAMTGPACTAPGAPGPDAAAARRTPPVAIVGWDAANWEVLDPLLEQRRLPHLARLLERGSRGRLIAVEPLLSPAAWTTLATGFAPEQHGVTGFLMPDPFGGPPILAASFHRRRAALWEMVSAAPGASVGFIGWWTTWPAEPVRGYLVSDHLAYNRWDAWARRPDDEAFALTWPASLAAELAPHAVRPERVDERALLALAPFDDRERREMMEAERPVMFHAPSVLRFGYSTDASNMSFARRLLATREQPDLFAVVFVLGDVAGHVFWHHHEPAAFPEAGADAGRLREAIPNVYALLDRWLGELLERLAPDTRILLVSDHGMRASGSLPRPGHNAAGDHDPEGVLVAAGPGIPAGRDLGRVSALDLVPTVLGLLDLPLARDMPGRMVAPVVDPDGGRSMRWIASYGESRARPWDSGADSPGAEALRERLRALGYID